MVIVTKPKPLHLLVCRSLITLTLCTAPNGPNNCHSTFSSVSGAKLYTKIHQPDPLIAFVGRIALPSRSPVSGENLHNFHIEEIKKKTNRLKY